MRTPKARTLNSRGETCDGKPSAAIGERRPLASCTIAAWQPTSRPSRCWIGSIPSGGRKSSWPCWVSCWPVWRSWHWRSCWGGTSCVPCAKPLHPTPRREDDWFRKPLVPRDPSDTSGARAGITQVHDFRAIFQLVIVCERAPSSIVCMTGAVRPRMRCCWFTSAKMICLILGSACRCREKSAAPCSATGGSGCCARPFACPAPIAASGIDMIAIPRAGAEPDLGSLKASLVRLAVRASDKLARA